MHAYIIFNIVYGSFCMTAQAACLCVFVRVFLLREISCTRFMYACQPVCVCVCVCVCVSGQKGPVSLSLVRGEVTDLDQRGDRPLQLCHG